MIYTIGYSKRTPEELTALIKKLRIDMLVDVRAKPYSRFKPEFNKKALTALLGERYVWKGDVLGGPGGGGEITKAGLTWLRAQHRAGKRLLLMCLEYAPGECHRHDIGMLLAPKVEVIHVYEGVGILATELARGIREEDDHYQTLRL